MRLLLLGLLLILSSLTAEEDIDRFSLLNVTSGPVSKIFQGVNVITGDLIDHQVIDTTSGPDPYTIATSYCSSNIEEGTLADGWDFLHPSELKLYMPQGIPKSLPEDLIEKGISNNAKIVYREPGGGLVQFMGTNGGHLFKAQLHGVGYSIGGLGAAHSSLYNVDIELAYRANQCIVTLGDGTRRVYHAINRPRRSGCWDEPLLTYLEYQIREEKLPSGRKRLYTYHSDHTLKSIDTLSRDQKHTLHSVSFKENSDHEITVTTSDGHAVTIPTVKVINEEKNKKRVVTDIYPHGSDKIHYHYDDKSPRHIRRVETISRPNGAEQTISYYREGDNYVGRTLVEPGKKSAAFLKGRVKTIKTKVADGTYQTTHFFYDRVAQTTTAVTALGKHIFRWDHHQRLDWSEVRTLDDKLVQKEEFLWNDKGFLTQRVLFDEAKHPILVRRYRYDENGNLTGEKLFGHWTGKHSPPLKFVDNKPTECDCYSITRSYSQDRFNLLTREEDSDGLFTEFRYLNKTNLPIAKYEGAHNKILKRTFWEYNDVVPIAIQTDDGSSHTRDHRSDVTFCTIKRITPRMQTPHFGEPREEREYSVVDGREYLIKGTRYHRNDQGLVIRQEEIGNDDRSVASQRFEYDKWDRITTMVDALGNRVAVAYDSLGRVESRRGPLHGHVITYKHNLLNQVVAEEERWPTGRIFTTRRQYDEHGRVTSTTDFRGRVTRTEYDLLNRPTRVIQPEVTRFQYEGRTTYAINPEGERSIIERSSYGSPLSVKAPNGATTTYQYDNHGRVIQETAPTGLITKTSYDSFGRPISIEQLSGSEVLSKTTKRYSAFFLLEENTPSGLTTKVEYDHFGRKKILKLIDTTQTRETHFAYDNANRVSMQSNPDSTRTLFQYDELGRVVEEKREGTRLLSLSLQRYDALGRAVESSVVTDDGLATTKTELLPNGLPISITDPLGHKTTFEYHFGKEFIKKSRDARGVVTREILDHRDLPIQVKTFDRMGGLIADKSIRYDHAGRPIRFEEKAIGGTDETIITEQAYHQGQLVRLTLAKGTPEEASSLYEYDKAGQKISESKPSGVKLHFAYDAKGRLHEQKSSDHTVHYRFTYDTSDRCTRALDLLTDKSVKRTYNSFNEVTKESLEGLHLLFDYNSFGACIAQTLPDHSIIEYDYQDGRLKHIRKGSVHAKITSRSLNGKIASMTLPYHAGEINYRYDLLGRTISVNHHSYKEERRKFDPAGNLLERRMNGVTERFSYDDLNQLLAEPTATYRYDSLNRRIEHSGKAIKHNALHHVLESGDEKLTYDQDGRRTRQKNIRYTYDALDRLTAVKTDTIRCSYGYDAFHRRLWKKVTDLAGKEISTEKFLYAGDNEIGSYQDGAIKELRILGEGLGAEIGASIAFEFDGDVAIPIHDLSGSVRTLVNRSGETIENYAYNAFGECTPSSDSSISPWRFASKRFDEEIGMQFFGRRYYDPSNGVWLTQDPLGIQAGPNLYAYVRNNPLTLFDLYGLEEQAQESRGFLGTISDIGSSIGSGALSCIEWIIFNGPHISDCNRDVSDAINHHLGKEPRELRGPKLSTATGRPVNEALSACKQAGQNTIPILTGGVSNTHADCLQQAQYALSLGQTGGYNVVDWFILSFGSDGIFMDAVGAVMHKLDWNTADIPLAKPILEGFLEQVAAICPEIPVQSVGWSKGGAAICHMYKQINIPKDVTYSLCTMGAPRFSRSPGAINYFGASDYVALFSPTNIWTIIMCPEKVRIVGQPGEFFLQTHNFQGPSYREAINDYYKRNFDRRVP